MELDGRPEPLQRQHPRLCPAARRARSRAARRAGGQLVDRPRRRARWGDPAPRPLRRGPVRPGHRPKRLLHRRDERASGRHRSRRRQRRPAGPERLLHQAPRPGSEPRKPELPRSRGRLGEAAGHVVQPHGWRPRLGALRGGRADSGLTPRGEPGGGSGRHPERQDPRGQGRRREPQRSPRRTAEAGRPLGRAHWRDGGAQLRR